MDTVFNEEKVRSSKENIKSSLPFYSEILDFYEKIFILQEREKLNYSPDPLILEKDEIANLPLISKERFVIDFERASDLFTKILEIAESGNRDLEGHVKVLRDKIGNKNLSPVDLLREILSNEMTPSLLEEKTEIHFDVLYMLLYNSIKPFVEISSEQLSSYLKKDEYDGGKCPVCGEHPYLSLLGNNGERYFLCGFCNHKWRSRRIFCPFCESSEKGKINYFFSEDNNFHRVEVCDSCKRYIKTVDLRNLGRAFYPQLEVLSTQHLDIKARELGYTG